MKRRGFGHTGAVGDVGGGVALGGEGEGKGGIDLEAKGWIISIFDKQADALRALLQHLFEASAAVNGWGLGFTTHKGQACC